MKITKKDKQTVHFSHIADGAVFEYDSDIYMKVSRDGNSMAVLFGDGQICTMISYANVTLLDAELIVKPQA
jgi:hypothetical protein